MTKLLIIYLGFLLIKAVLVMLPVIIKNCINKTIPRRQYTAEEVIRCGHMRPDLYYRKQLMEQDTSNKVKPKEITTLTKTNLDTYKEVDVNVVRELFKKKMQHRELTRNQILAIKSYLMQFVDCKEKKFDNDCHCIYYCLKQLDKEKILDLTPLANLLK